MLDTVHLWLSGEQAGGIDLPALVADFVEYPTLHQRSNGHEWISGRLGNLIVSAGSSGISVKGSFNTYYYRHNQGNLTRQDSQRVVEQLSDVLHLPISRATVNRVDVGRTFLTKHPPAAYYSRLGVAHHYKRLSQPESIRYQNGKRQLVFYDKVAESKHAHIPIPDIWVNRNALRYEGRFVSRLPNQFNRASVTAADLYSEDFYMTLVDRWVLEFEQLPKVKRTSLELEQAMLSRKNFTEIAERLLIQQLGGEVATLELIEQNRLQGAYKNRVEVKRLKDRIREAGQPIDIEYIPTTDLVDELRDKVRQAQKHYR